MSMRVITCPNCGKRALRTVTGPVTFRVRGKSKTFPNVARLVCGACGEQLFDRDANRTLDAHRGKRRTRGPILSP
jgi:YgiT-type zinc finger domain-containing protein